MPQTIHEKKKVRILYNPELVEADPELLFTEAETTSLKRGEALFFAHKGMPLVLKRYHRGGFVGRIISHTYFEPASRTPRMWKEYELLESLQELGLPVPEPVAARCKRTSPLSYRGELITRQLMPAHTLIELISNAALSELVWEAVGRTLKRFHDLDVYHADLNASNILIDIESESDPAVYLIDFDKGEIRQGDDGHWKQDNIKRLRRSLDKFQKADPALHFTEQNWQNLLKHYA